MKRYFVKITKEAENDIHEIHDYIYYSLSNPQAAENLFNKFIKAIDSLTIFPYGHPTIDLKTDTGLEFHKIVIGNYQMFYHIQELIVWVTDILPSRSNIIERLKQRHSK